MILGKDVTDIMLSILAVLVIAGLTVLLFFSVKKEKKNYKNEVAEIMEGVLKKNEIISSINGYIKNSPSTLIFSLIMFDYDKFMELQNAFGANNSKKILEESIKNIRRILPPRVQIGRIGEDRFLVLVKEDYDKNETLRFANKIKDTASKGIKIYADTIINPTVSVGVAFYPTHGKSYKQLMTSLDLAVFNAKQNGGNCVELYSDEFDKEDIDNLQFYYEVKEAIKEQQFVLYYQPIINLEDNTIYGLETLLRWNHPSLGILPPSSFINMLEQSGDINAVGVWGIETLIKEYIELRKIFIHKDLQLSINLSPKQLMSDTLGITFQIIAKKYKIPVDHITIEIIEFAMFEKHEIVYQNINNLKEIGFKIAVDGFGIDQNTLAKLGEAPIDIIKLDRNLLSDEDSYIQSKYIELLIDFAKKTNKVIICEGIEELDNVEKVKSFGVNYAQGYYFSKPLPQDQICEFIANEDNLETLIYHREELEVKEENNENADPNQFKITIDNPEAKDEEKKDAEEVAIEEKDTAEVSKDETKIPATDKADIKDEIKETEVEGEKKETSEKDKSKTDEKLETENAEELKDVKVEEKVENENVEKVAEEKKETAENNKDELPKAAEKTTKKSTTSQTKKTTTTAKKSTTAAKKKTATTSKTTASKAKSTITKKTTPVKKTEDKKVEKVENKDQKEENKETKPENK